MKIAGVILAGGAGLRLGGVDKAMVRLGGRPLLAWVCDALTPQVDGVVLSANGDAARFAGFGLPVVGDEGPLAGPLGGVVAALSWWAGQPDPPDAVAFAPVDTPFLPLDLVTRLGEAASTAPLGCAAARSKGRLHPTLALLAASARPQLRQNLAKGELRLTEAIEALYPAITDFDAETDDPFFNINRPEDLTAAERRLANWAL